jgi:hypothetical protein
MATITTTVSIDSIDGEAKSITGTGTIEAMSIVTGKQTVGNSYETFATSFITGNMLIVKNTSSTVDVSLRLDLEEFTSKRYVSINVPAGQIGVVPMLWGNDKSSGMAITRVADIAARTDSGTADVDYCIIY